MNLLLGDCLETLKNLADNSVDSVVTDPPYGLSFMGKKWDYDVPSSEIWREVLRVLKPGGHMLAACGTRTQHRMAVNIEDAGFEVRDVICWHYGSGFPKSQNISLAIDKQLGAIGNRGAGFNVAGQNVQLNQNKELRSDHPDYVAPSSKTEEAKQWNGWGTALKPATEFFTLARKPISEKTVAKNVLKHGVGGINVDAGRIEGVPRTTHADGNRVTCEAESGHMKGKKPHGPTPAPSGRFPANVIFDDFTAGILDQQSGTLLGRGNVNDSIQADNGMFGNGITRNSKGLGKTLPGGASRFFKVISPSKRDSNDACVQSVEAQQNLDESSVLEAVRELLLLLPEDSRQSKTVRVKSAGKNSKSTPLTSRASTSSALGNAMPILDLASLYLNASGVDSQTKDIEARIAQSLASHLAKLENRSKACLVSISEHSAQTLLLNHAIAAEVLANIDTTTTTVNPIKLNGFASLVTVAIINWASGEPNIESDQSRFRYQAKASKRERNEGLEGASISARKLDGDTGKSSFASEFDSETWKKVNANHHPTVKPVKLMQYLIKLVTPEGGTVLDPFMGSGSTGVAAKSLGFKFIGCELSDEYMAIAKKRIEGAKVS